MGADIDKLLSHVCLPLILLGLRYMVICRVAVTGLIIDI